MADMYGTLRSNTFAVKDVEKFKAWFSGYHFGYEIQVCVDEETRNVCFGGYEQYPSAFPQLLDAEGCPNDTGLESFAEELCEHMEDGEVFTVVAGGNEKLRYVSFNQLIIDKAHPDKPYFEQFRSDVEKERLARLVLSKRDVAKDMHKIRVPDSPFTVDLEASNEEYLSIDLDHGVTVAIKVSAEGIVIDAFPKPTQGDKIQEAIASTWAAWHDVREEEQP